MCSWYQPTNHAPPVLRHNVLRGVSARGIDARFIRHPEIPATCSTAARISRARSGNASRSRTYRTGSGFPIAIEAGWDPVAVFGVVSSIEELGGGGLRHHANRACNRRSPPHRAPRQSLRSSRLQVDGETERFHHASSEWSHWSTASYCRNIRTIRAWSMNPSGNGSKTRACRLGISRPVCRVRAGGAKKERGPAAGVNGGRPNHTVRHARCSQTTGTGRQRSTLVEGPVDATRAAVFALGAAADDVGVGVAGAVEARDGVHGRAVVRPALGAAAARTAGGGDGLNDVVFVFRHGTFPGPAGAGTLNPPRPGSLPRHQSLEPPWAAAISGAA